MSRLLSSKYLLILICALLLFTRFYKITEIPPSVYWDEASIGYNAYSIVQTGKDEWGEFLPIHFRAFGEFKLPVYIYTVAIFVKIFGLSEFSVRFPAVLFSLGVVIFTYLLAKKLTNSTAIGLLSSFFVAVSPWYFIFSRVGYEATAGLMFYLLGVYLFLRYLENRWSILFLTVSFILSAYSYNSFRIISPLTIILLIIFERSNLRQILRKQKAALLVSIILLSLAVIPIYRLFVYDAGISRFNAISSSPRLLISNYLSHFNPKFLFISGDKNLRSQQAGFGQLYLPEAFLLVAGFIYMLKSKEKYRWLPAIFVLLAPIPAAITKESPHGLRVLSEVPFICMISAMGIASVNWIPVFAGMTKRIITFAVVLVFLGLFANYFINFINIYPAQSSKDWQYGYKRIFTDYREEFKKYNRVIISDEYAQPYIFALFYLNYSPEKFRNNVTRNDVSDWGFSTVSKFNKFEFGKVNKLLETGNPSNRLIFATEEDKILAVPPLSSVKFLDGTIAFWVYEL